MARNSVSLQDVAREAGVSPQTVSRVANGSDAVRPATKLKVEAAMEHLGYRPNYAARALKSGHFNNVGVLLSHMSAYGNSRWFQMFLHLQQMYCHPLKDILQYTAMSEPDHIQR